MTQAEQHSVVINAARGRIDFNTQVVIAAAQAISELRGIGDELLEVEFADKSILVFDHDAQTATAYA